MKRLLNERNILAMFSRFCHFRRGISEILLSLSLSLSLIICCRLFTFEKAMIIYVWIMNGEK